jgi:threonine dehydrogenase-like Zn-dependent dehydrogenase
MARSIGAIPISFNQSDPVQQILAYEPSGVTRVVDAVGFEAVNAQLRPDENIVLEQMVAVAQREGGLGILGLYISGNSTKGGPLSGNYPGNFTFPFGDYFGKALSMNVGPVNPFTNANELVNLIHSGRSRPSFVVTTEIRIEDAPEAYARYERHEQGKTVIRFP